MLAMTAATQSTSSEPLRTLMHNAESSAYDIAAIHRLPESSVHRRIENLSKCEMEMPFL